MNYGPKITDPRPATPGRRLYLILILLSILSILGLDFLAARRGDKAYIFTPRARETRLLLTESVRDFLGASGVPPESIREVRDEDGFPLFIIQLTAESYAGLEPRLEEELGKTKSQFERERKQFEGWISHSWRITGEAGEPLSLIFTTPRPPAIAKKKREEAVPAPLPAGLVAIIIDDMGNSLEAMEEICNFGQPVTISILPRSTHAEATAQIAHENGLEVMLHLPGESLNNHEDNAYTAGLIRSDMSREEIQALVEDSIARVPYIRGVNNHMGSKITQEESVMRPILEILKRHNLFFLDSRTTADTIAFSLARKMGLQSASRNVFLDTTVGVEFSKQKLAELVRLAKRTGRAIGIGHPFPETLQALRENLPLLSGQSVKPVFVSEIIRKE